MEVFLQCHSRQIMIISIFQVKDDHIHQAGIWERFYNIRSVANMIATKQLLFIGNFYRDTFSDRPVKLMLIISCNNLKPEQVDCPQYQNKYTFVGNLCLLFKITRSEYLSFEWNPSGLNQRGWWWKVLESTYSMTTTTKRKY